MSIRKHPTKEGFWYIVIEGEFISKKGKKVRQRYELFQGTREEALTCDAEMNNRPAAVQYPTIIEILPRFLAAYQNNVQPHSYKVMENSLKHILPYYGSMRIPLISEHHHEEYKALRLKRAYLPGKFAQLPSDDTPDEAAKRKPLAKSSINRELVCLKSILTFAKRGKIAVNDTPMLFPKRQAAGKVIQPLAPSEMEQVLQCVAGNQAAPIWLMMMAGLRLTEAVSLRVEDINLKNGCIHVSGKGGNDQAIGIIPGLMPFLVKAINGRTSGYLSINPQTGKPYTRIRRTLETCCKRAGMTRKVSHHTLRHSCATALILAGHSVPFVQAYLRHVNSATTMDYVHIAARIISQKEKDAACRLFPLLYEPSPPPKVDRVICVINFSKNGPVYADL